MASAPNISAQSIAGDPDPDRGLALLARLRDAHQLLANAMDALECLTSGPAGCTSFPSARWHLSAANRARRAVWEDCYLYLEPLVGQASAVALTGLKSEDMDLARASISHIARWPTPAAELDWLAYCTASRLIRSRMSGLLEAERRLLYPLLRMHR